MNDVLFLLLSLVLFSLCTDDQHLLETPISLFSQASGAFIEVGLPHSLTMRQYLAAWGAPLITQDRTSAPSVRRQISGLCR